MSYLPISIDIGGKPVTVVGGGTVATGRVRALIGSSARVKVISPAPSEEIERWAAAGAISLHRRGYRSGDLAGSVLAMTATDDPEVNRAAFEEARAAGIWINAADVPSHCDFIMPSILRRGDLSVAISTSGRSPALAVRLRQQIARMIGPEYARLVEVLHEARQRIRERVSDPGRRRELQYRLVDSDLLELVRHGNSEAIRARVEEAIGEDSRPAHASPRGIVYIVGAGPGDPGLITVRGLDRLRRADVVLHDRLIGSGLLESASPHAEVIDVGKRAGDQGRMQRFIEDTMVRRAREGEIVCRLKGGDPFVFGRGGEEARALTAASIPYEIVPGVTSAIAAPAAAGIPLTHRDYAHSFLVMTGSRAERARPEEWAGASELLRVGGTLVVMMGLAHLEAIVERLRSAGCPDRTPAAIVSRGTLPDQDVLVGTLATIASSHGGPVSPGVVVFGEVVREREKLAELARAAAGGAESAAGSLNRRISPE